MWKICLFSVLILPIFVTSNSSTEEQTFIMIKPDGVQRGLIGRIITRFEQKGFKLLALKLMKPSNQLLMEHYSELKDKPFFPQLMTYMESGPLVAMVWEGLDVVKISRQMLGATNPAESEPGSIRADFSINVARNIIHGSDSVASAKREIALWFSDEEVVMWTSINENWIYE